MTFDVGFARSFFPALDQGWALFDNAGGAAMPRPVIERIHHYLSHYQIQLGASYALSQDAQEHVNAGHRVAAALLGATPEETILGPSTTTNVNRIARAVATELKPGDEIVVTDLDHEANVGGWRRATDGRGITVRTWSFRPDSTSLDIEDLLPLLNERTRWVCFTHCSNIVGEVADVAEIARAIRRHSSARVCVDGVAFAPHRFVDVKALDVDVYVASLYKIGGPHLGVMYGREDLLTAVPGENHFFIAGDNIPYKFQPGGVTHELVAGVSGMSAYFDQLAEHHGITGESDIARRKQLMEKIVAHEQVLAERLLTYLWGRPEIRVLGPGRERLASRVPTVAFTVEGRPSASIPPYFDELKLAIRYGDFYARRAMDRLGLSAEDGVVRVSMYHYNTLEEVDRVIAGLEQLLTRS